MTTVIPLTRPQLPPLDRLLPYLEQIWESGQLTNGGAFHQQFEQALAAYLGVAHVSLFANGTLALMIALRALEVRGEVITTPYSFVATAHALRWNQLTPVFVDIDPVTLNLDPACIEAAITSRTSAIMPVHCYGRRCDTAAIHAIAERHGLRVIYDAAHAFGIEDAGGSVLRHGDSSILSLHATKVFNTFEGGAIISPSLAAKQRVDALRNFGFVDEVSVASIGINAKMCEFNAAVGLLQLQTIDQVLQARAAVDRHYRLALAGIPGIEPLPPMAGQTSNHSYFPLRVSSGYPLSRDQLYERLRAADIHVRRYFYPLICDLAAYRSQVDAVRHPLPQASLMAAQVLCLPIYPDLAASDLARVVRVIRCCAGEAPANPPIDPYH